ncbi:MAG: hypothetical protein GX072_06495 [Lysinibacillus sp.]|nr:hypothetical protein [Lysinibacillus sp.]
MGKVYSAHNIAAYFIYELNETNTFVNAKALQFLLSKVKEQWEKEFGYNPFKEQSFSLTHNGFVVKEVFDAYKENGDAAIVEPAKEWFLQYGDFQLILRPYAIPSFTFEEQQLVQKVLEQYRNTIMKKAS